MELKFKVMVLRVLMLILYKVAFPSKDSRDTQEVDRIAIEVHNFIKTMDEFQRASHNAQVQEGTPDRPTGKMPVVPRAPLRMKATA